MDLEAVWLLVFLSSLIKFHTDTHAACTYLKSMDFLRTDLLNENYWLSHVLKKAYRFETSLSIYRLSNIYCG